MVGIKCVNCSFAGVIEDQGITYQDIIYSNVPATIIFTHQGHNPFSGNLQYQCPQCKTMTLVDPLDVLGYESVTDVRQKPRRKSFFELFFLCQGEWHFPIAG
jgi:hypothetical protein